MPAAKREGDTKLAERIRTAVATLNFAIARGRSGPDVPGGKKKRAGVVARGRAYSLSGIS